MRYACTFGSVDGEVFDVTVCEECKRKMEDDCDLLYSQTVFKVDGETPRCEYCNG